LFKLDLLKANLFAQLIEERLATDQEFLIVGYSFGGLIALEILKLLEKNNRTGKLWLIDSSPQFLKMTTELAIRGEKAQEHEIQVQLIMRFLDLVWPHSADDVSFAEFKLLYFL